MIFQIAIVLFHGTIRVLFRTVGALGKRIVVNGRSHPGVAPGPSQRPLMTAGSSAPGLGSSRRLDPRLDTTSESNMQSDLEDPSLGGGHVPRAARGVLRASRGPRGAEISRGPRAHPSPPLPLARTGRAWLHGLARSGRAWLPRICS